ncbi:MAG: hypothetical protein GF328_13765 [Candidatus Latescibacteria bacterium]|nr:hypothetical protein [Candidatus Latescibacterota bacterium]
MPNSLSVDNTEPTFYLQIRTFDQIQDDFRWLGRVHWFKPKEHEASWWGKLLPVEQPAEITVERDENSTVLGSPSQDGDVGRASHALPHRQHIMTFVSKRGDAEQRDVLVGQEPHYAVSRRVG